LSDKYFGRSLPALAWFCQTKVWTPFSEKLYKAMQVLKKINDLQKNQKSGGQAGSSILDC